ncbi:MAG: hypothetical protein DRZ79_03975 [Candidatus Cloacimonadota bacterium]|nr:MAG: hypothetical protein DRZ79_03975 [Candidatus Cloacimonadota bacterium]
MSEFSLNEIIELAVQIEKNGYNFYDNALKRKDLSPRAKEMLTMLRDEELIHEKTFKNLRDDVDLELLDKSGDWLTVENYLRTIAESHIFLKPDAAINLAVNSKDEKEIISNAIAFEKDTLLFFYSLNDTVKNEKSRKIIEKIIKEEISHVMKLDGILKTM